MLEENTNSKMAKGENEVVTIHNGVCNSGVHYWGAIISLNDIA